MTTPNDWTDDEIDELMVLDMRCHIRAALKAIGAVRIPTKEPSQKWLDDIREEWHRKYSGPTPKPMEPNFNWKATGRPAGLDDGGAAFPVPDRADQLGRRGMTLRDYFAAKSLAAYVASMDSVRGNVNMAAAWAYEQADAMLKERAK